jgi:hypothetical protein
MLQYVTEVLICFPKQKAEQQNKKNILTKNQFEGISYIKIWGG